MTSVLPSTGFWEGSIAGSGWDPVARICICPNTRRKLAQSSAIAYSRLITAEGFLCSDCRGPEAEMWRVLRCDGQ